jgi:hypothetical protein
MDEMAAARHLPPGLCSPVLTEKMNSSLCKSSPSELPVSEARIRRDQRHSRSGVAMCARMMKTVVVETPLDHDTSDYSLRSAVVKFCPCRSAELGVMFKNLIRASALLSILPMGRGFQL